MVQDNSINVKLYQFINDNDINSIYNNCLLLSMQNN